MRFGTLAFAAVVSAGGVASAQSETMYVLDSPINPFLLTLNKDTGGILTIDSITNEQSLFGGLAIDGADDLYSIDGYNDEFSDRLFKIDKETGEGEVVGDTGYNWNFRSVTVHPQTDVLYGTRDNELFTFDKSTGLATSIAVISEATLDQLTAMVIGADGVAYGTDIGDTGLFRIDLTTGQATHLGNVGQSGNWFEDLAFDSEGVLWGARVQGGMHTIDIDSGTQELQFGGAYPGVVFEFEGAGKCIADCDGNGALNVLDFVCFQGEWQKQTPTGDCDGNGTYNILDFVCYQGAFQAGCP
jgi:hypothetical protein